MKFRLEIASGNEAFTPEPAFEVARILREIADRLDILSVPDDGYRSAYVFDINGNRVGDWYLEPNDDEDEEE